MKIGRELYRCDACKKISQGKDVFKQFSLVKFDPVTKRVIAGIAGESDPKAPAILHSCPPCESKITLAAKLNNPIALPPGPLRDYFQAAKSKDILRSLRLY